MKNGAISAIAITAGAAGVFAYLYLTRHPEAVPAAGANASVRMTTSVKPG